jgi:hypothetical protein
VLCPYGSLPLSTGYAGAAPCTRAGGPPPGNPRWGRFTSPNPLGCGTAVIEGLCRRCALHPRRGPAPWQPPLGPFHFPKPLGTWHCCYRGLMQALRPAPAPGASPLATPVGAVSLPQTPWDMALLLSRAYAGAAPCTRAGGPPPGNPRWGRFTSPNPLKFRAF